MALAGAVTIGTLLATLGLDAVDFNRGLSAAEKKAHGLAGVLKGPLGAASVAATAALTGVAAAAGGLGVAMGASVKSAMDFEKTMSGVKAVSGASAADMAQLSGLALQLGKDTSFSATEAALGLEELVKGGVSITDILGGAAKASLDLAAAGSIGLADAAEIASNAMNSFGLTGKDMTNVANQIAGAANASSLSVTDFKFSLAAVGAVAKLAGQDFNSTATAIAMMGAAGIKGQDAGTSLKTMLMNLQPTTKEAKRLFSELGIVTAEGANQFFDASGKAKGMREIADVLNQSLKGLTQQQKLAALETMFGSDAIRAAAVLADGGAAAYDKMAESMGKVTAASVGAERLNNLAGALEQLKGGIETAAITFGMALLPMLKDAVTGFDKMVESAMPWIEQAGPKFAEALKTVGGFISTEVLPRLAEFAGWIIRDGLPKIGELATNLRDTLVPAFSAVWGFIQQNVLPILGESWQFIHEQMIPKVREFAGVFRDQMIPQLVDFVAKARTAIDEGLMKLLEQFEKRETLTKFNDAMRDINESIAIIREMLGGSGGVNEQMGIANGLFEAAGFVIDTMVVEPFRKWAAQLKTVVQAFADINKLIGDFHKLLPGGAGLLLPGGGFGNLPGRAAGGPVAANRPYLIGEQGPELFVPGRSGTVVPDLGMMGGGAGIDYDRLAQAVARRPIYLDGRLISESVRSHQVRTAERNGRSPLVRR